MSTSLAIADLRVTELLARIGSNAASSGAGVAAAVALALAAACASKAVSISLKHEPGDPELQRALVALEALAGAALLEGRDDAEAFGAFLHDKRPSALNQLIRQEEKFGQLITSLTGVMDVVAPRIRANMTGDMVAAWALAAAARRIQSSNEDEAVQERQS